MEFTREELSVIFQALVLAEQYYKDPNRRVKGMHKPDATLVEGRLKAIEPLINKITRHAMELS
jgi:hypothetical protein